MHIFRLGILCGGVVNLILIHIDFVYFVCVHRPTMLIEIMYISLFLALFYLSTNLVIFCM